MAGRTRSPGLSALRIDSGTSEDDLRAVVFVVSTSKRGGPIRDRIRSGTSTSPRSAAARRTPSVPVTLWLRRLAAARPAASSISKLLVVDYAGMVNDGLLFEEPPKFETLVARCRAIQDRANNIDVTPSQSR